MEFIHILWQNLTGQWMLLLWILPACVLAHKGQRLKISLFIVLLAVVLQLQVEVIQSTGFDKGFTGWVDISIFKRGLVVHSIFIALFTLLSYISPRTRSIIYLAAALSLFFMSFFVSSLVMLV